MSNELVVIEKSNALTVLSDKQGVEKLIEDVRERVMSLEGGSLETAKGRKTIRSNAFKATKAKTAIADEFIKPLIVSITEKIQPDLDAIQSLKDNQKILNAGLDQIRKDVNAEVQAIDDEIKRKADEEAAQIEAEKIALEIERDHELALLMNTEFDRVAAEQAAEAKRIEDERLAKEESDRIARENEIREEAEKAAKEQAEKDKLQLIMDNAHGEALLINRDIDDAAKEAQRVIDEAEAELKRQQREKEIQEKSKRDAEAAEEKRLADIEQAKQEEIQRQKDEEARIAADKAKREADNKHIGEIRKAAKESIMALGVDEEKAKEIVMAIHGKKIANVQINY